MHGTPLEELLRNPRQEERQRIVATEGVQEALREGGRGGREGGREGG